MRSGNGNNGNSNRPIDEQRSMEVVRAAMLVVDAARAKIKRDMLLDPLPGTPEDRLFKAVDQLRLHRRQLARAKQLDPHRGPRANRGVR